MKHTTILLGLLALASCSDTGSMAFAWDSNDRPNQLTYPPRDSYERQLLDQQRYNYDSQRNGSLRQESNIQREERQRQESYQDTYQHSQSNSTWGNTRDNRQSGYGGASCGLYDC